MQPSWSTVWWSCLKSLSKASHLIGASSGPVWRTERRPSSEPSCSVGFGRYVLGIFRCFKAKPNLMSTHSRYPTFLFIQSRIKFKMLQWSSDFESWIMMFFWSLACSLSGCLKFSYPHAASRSPNKAPLFFGSGLGIGTYPDLGTRVDMADPVIFAIQWQYIWTHLITNLAFHESSIPCRNLLWRSSRFRSARNL